MQELVAKFSELQTKENIELVESEMMKHEQVSCPVVHSFGPGVYIREVKMPAGSIVIGHHQNFEHMNIFLKGKVSMIADDGSVKTITAPMMFTGKPGRKIGYIHEDVVWLNVYSTDEQDVEKLESHFLTKSEAWKESLESIKKIQTSVDKLDFKQAISDLGFDEKTVAEHSENESDMVMLPFGSYKFKLAKSNIHGQGLFATGFIQAGEIICPARIGSKRTVAGRYTNHSINPNAKMVAGIDGEILLIAISNITGCVGGLDGEEITIDYREAVSLNLKLSRGPLCQV